MLSARPCNRGKTSNGHANVELYDSPNLVGGGYLTFFVSVIKNTITKTKILIMYFFIATTPLSSISLKHSFSIIYVRMRWHNRPVKKLFSIITFFQWYYILNFFVLQDISTKCDISVIIEATKNRSQFENDFFIASIAIAHSTLFFSNSHASSYGLFISPLKFTAFALQPPLQ